jgi:L-fuconolactonase
MSITIDSHLHLWQLSRFDYGWIPVDNAALHQDRLPEDVIPQMCAAGIERAVLVHAANTTEEIKWLLSLCDAHSCFAGVVGWVDMTSPFTLGAISSFAMDSRFRGVRVHLPIDPLHDEAVNASLRALASHQLSCDLLLGLARLPDALALIKAHPEVTFILDHLAGAQITIGGASDFQHAIAPFAQLPNVFMKLSGFMTARYDLEVSALPTVLAQYVRAAMSILGAERLMFGSDWPVSSQAAIYGQTTATLRDITARLSANEQFAIWGGSSLRAYRLQ